MTAWLRHHAFMTGKDAARLATAAKRLRHLPVTVRAWSEGEISSGQLQAVLGAVKRPLRALFEAHEAEVVRALVGLSVTDTARAMAHWAAHAQGLVEDEEPAEPKGELHLSQTLDDTWVLDGTLGPLSGQLVSNAIRLAQSPDSEAEEKRTPAEGRADALTDICRFFLDHQATRPGGRHRPHLNVVVDLEDLEAGLGGRVVDGAFLDQGSLSALLCDSALHRVVMRGRSSVLDYGTSTRTVPAPLWNALVLRDEHCRFPGCDRRSSWCEAHHVIAVEHDGPTCMSNLVLMCSRHHHRLHRPGWQAKLRPDATLEVTDPQGRHWETNPPQRAGPARE